MHAYSYPHMCTCMFLTDSSKKWQSYNPKIEISNHETVHIVPWLFQTTMFLKVSWLQLLPCNCLALSTWVGTSGSQLVRHLFDVWKSGTKLWKTWRSINVERRLIEIASHKSCMSVTCSKEGIQENVSKVLKYEFTEMKMPFSKGLMGYIDCQGSWKWSKNDQSWET